MLKKKILIEELRPKGRFQKIILIETILNNKSTVVNNTLNEEQLETAILITKCRSKIHKLTIYYAAINNPIYRSY